MATLSSTISGFSRSDLTAETKAIAIPFTSIRTWDNMAVNLPATPGTDDMGLVTGTPGTAALMLQATDPGGTTVTQKFGFEYILPVEYIDGGDVSIRVKGKVATTIADDHATIDFSVYLDGKTGTVGADIMAGSAFSINNTSVQSSDMLITASTLTAGAKIMVVGTVDSSDVGNAGVMTPTILSLEIVITVKG